MTRLFLTLLMIAGVLFLIYVFYVVATKKNRDEIERDLNSFKDLGNDD